MRAGTQNNESMVAVHAPAWTRVVVCAGTQNNASMVTVYAPAWTTVVVWASTPHNMLRVTIHAPAWTKEVVRVGTPSVTICDVYRGLTDYRCISSQSFSNMLPVLSFLCVSSAFRAPRVSRVRSFSPRPV